MLSNEDIIGITVLTPGRVCIMCTFSGEIRMCFEAGKPSVGRCKKIRMKREEAQELAELDVNNIISSQGNMIYGGLRCRN